jgi:hypothetical protein
MHSCSLLHVQTEDRTMSRLQAMLIAAAAGIGALAASACESLPTQAAHGHAEAPQAGMLDQMRAHHRCVEGEMAKQKDGGRAMPDKEAMTAMMQRCPMSAAMQESMMMMMHGSMKADDGAEHPDHPKADAPSAPH